MPLSLRCVCLLCHMTLVFSQGTGSCLSSSSHLAALEFNSSSASYGGVLSALSILKRPRWSHLNFSHDPYLMDGDHSFEPAGTFAVMITSHSSSKEPLRVMLPLSYRFMRPEAHPWYLCLDKWDHSAPPWVTQLVYQSYPHDNWSARQAQCVAMIKEDIVLFLMDDWPPIGKVSYPWLQRVIEILLNNSMIHFIATGPSHLTLGGITTPWPEFLFNSAAMVQPSIWKTASFRRALEASAFNPQWIESSQYKNIQRGGRSSKAVYLEMFLGYWARGHGAPARHDTTSWNHYPGLSPAPYSFGQSMAFPLAHLVGGGRWRELRESCAALKFTGLLGVSNSNITFSKTTNKCHDPDRLKQSFESCTRYEPGLGPEMALALKTQHDPDAIRVVQRVPAECSLRWAATKDSAIHYSRNQTKNGRSLLIEYTNHNKTNPLAFVCCVHVSSKWRMEKGDAYVCTVNNNN